MVKMVTSNNKLVMGIDSSTSCTGYCFMDSKGLIVDYGKILPPGDISYLQKCDFIASELIKVIEPKKECIIKIGIEMLNSSVNMKITRILAGLAQIIRYSIYKKYNMVVEEINTKQHKKFLTGNGNADKFQTIRFVNKKYKLGLKFHKTNKEKSDDDIADAISVAFSTLGKI